MSQNRGQVDSGGNNVQKQGPGDIIMDQKKIYPITTVGAGVIPPEAILAGIILRTGPVGGYADTFPDASALLAACPMLDVGDSFEFLYINGVAQAMTAAAGTGVVLAAPTGIAASLVRRYMITILGDGLPQVFAANALNGQAVVTGMTPAQVKTLTPGMGVTGTNVPANTFIVAVNQANGTVTLSANVTGAITLGALTFFPRYELRGLYSATA